jgi:hypothetical protein
LTGGITELTGGALTGGLGVFAGWGTVVGPSLWNGDAVCSPRNWVGPEKDGEDDCGGDSNNGVGSLTVSVFSNRTGTPQVPQNRASGLTECLFMHIAMPITAPL